ncbi:hypothetical protein SPRG_04474 [Saprolegnia parasitica CBS 223.65]|uniref:Uncharacterized protein n=1 Tax=Saprolegnia parasitica (strain CBS 223.65) TaxID=695850 RepID=A0A067CJ70_SAPPC|nr:hypothetical protein SPRG_04474 [Saprolegnia parasitica CBS 223.65]KDO30573.1 hypothetical protein SPRG_04474 [Saprolegnia parasitica CBS 223.65]|eukprot:XP_012198788.1 hypothetical protein SPRG_04474 [Saprolegnia parasitica CBS 223.65]
MNSAVYHVSTLQIADQICIWDFGRWPITYSHHGIVYTRGETPDDVIVAHTWSPLQNFAESQADSCFRLTTLTQFLDGRSMKYLRRVQYNSSILGDTISKLGEVHRSSSAPAAATLTFLVLNCEHVANWCKTGRLFAKQIFTSGPTSIPYERQRSVSQHLDSLVSQTLCSRLNSLDPSTNQRRRVYLKLKDTTKYVQVRGNLLYVVEVDLAETEPLLRNLPSPFYARAEQTDINTMKVTFEDVSSGRLVCSKAKCVKLIRPRIYHRENLFRFEYAYNGELQSRRLRRWYVGVQPKDGLLRTSATRDFASEFELVDADALDKDLDASECNLKLTYTSSSELDDLDDDDDEGEDDEEDSDDGDDDEDDAKRTT